MGSVDLGALKAVFDDSEVTLIGAGFTQNDMVTMFGASVFDDRSKDLTEFAEHLSNISEKYSGVSEANRKKGQSEHYLIFVFPSGDVVDGFIKAQMLQDNRYQNGMMLIERLKAAVASRSPAADAPSV
jgi:hypothetical protein